MQVSRIVSLGVFRYGCSDPEALSERHAMRVIIVQVRVGVPGGSVLEDFHPPSSGLPGRVETVRMLRLRMHQLSLEVFVGW